MKAAILREFKAPLTLEEVDQPKPGVHDVLIQVEACGVCHSDLHLADGDWDLLKPITKVPLILGHEVAGEIAAVGEGVSQLRVGDRCLGRGVIPGSHRCHLSADRGDVYDRSS